MRRFLEFLSFSILILVIVGELYAPWIIDWMKH